MLVLSLCMNSGSARPVRWDGQPAQGSSDKALALAAPTTASAADQPAFGQPEHFSIAGVVGKLSLALLLLYGTSFGFLKARKSGFLSPFGAAPPTAQGQRLQLRDTLTLGRQEGTLYLIEVDGQVLLLGATAEQLELLWATGREQAMPVTPLAKPSEDEEPTARLPLPDDLPLFRRGFGKPPREEADWARERSRLISALAQAE